jgi:hypothetical protein
LLKEAKLLLGILEPLFQFFYAGHRLHYARFGGAASRLIYLVIGRGNPKS